MQFYYVTDNSFRNRRWTWAWKTIPSLQEISEPCNVCGKGRLYPGRYPARPLQLEVERGSGYPSMLGCAASLLVVSAAVLHDWQSNGVTGYQKFPATVVKATGTKIAKLVPPQYFHIQVTGRCELDLEAMGIR